MKKIHIAFATSDDNGIRSKAFMQVWPIRFKKRLKRIREKVILHKPQRFFTIEKYFALFIIWLFINAVL